MYNLFVSGSEDSWNGEPWVMNVSRCVNEYTDNALIERFGQLDPTAVEELKRLPSIFAYETARNIPPHFGIIRDAVKRQGMVRVEYEFQHVEPFPPVEDLEKLTFELDVGNWEMNRTHWAVKDINLPACGARHRPAVLDEASDQGGRHLEAPVRRRTVFSRRSARDCGKGGPGAREPDRPELLFPTTTIRRSLCTIPTNPSWMLVATRGTSSLLSQRGSSPLRHAIG